MSLCIEELSFINGPRIQNQKLMFLLILKDHGKLKWSYFPILINYFQTNTVFIGRSLSTGRATWLSSIPAKEISCGAKRMPNK